MEPARQPDPVYDDDSAQAVTRPDLRALEGGGETTEPRRGHLSSVPDDTAAGSVADTNQPGTDESVDNKRGGGAGKLAAAEGAAAAAGGLAAGAASEAGQLHGALDQLGAGFNALDEAKNLKATLSGALSGKGKLFAGGGAGATLIAIVIMLIGGASLELVHIEKIMQGFESRIEQNFEKDGAKHVLSRILKKSLARAKAARAGAPNPDAAEVAAATANGEVLTKDMDNFNLEGFKTALAAKGINANFDSAGNLTRITNGAGEDISNTMSDADFKTIEGAMPEWAVGQLESYRPLLVDQYGVTFKGLPDTTGDNVKKSMEQDVSKGATQEDILAANEDTKALSDQAPTNQSGTTTTTPSDVAQAQTDTSSLGKAIDATNTSISTTGDAAGAIDAGVKAFGVENVSSSLLVGAAATTACTVKKDVNTASKARIPQLVELLIRHGNLLLSLGSQLQSGHITGNEVNQAAQIVNGDPSAVPTKLNPSPEAALPFNNSAGYQRAVGGVVDRSTPDISPAELPSKIGAQKIVDEINKVFNVIPGANLGCQALTSGWGILIQGALGLGQLVVDIGSFGTAQAVTTGALVTFQIALTKVILPDVLRYFTVAGISGTEDSVQWLNNSDAGLNLSFNDYGRRIGAKPLTKSQYGLVASRAAQSQLAEQQQQSWLSRTFALSNPYSLASRLFFSLPFGSIYNINSAVQNYFVHLPTDLAHAFASLVTPHKLFADTPNSANNPYGITQYSFTGNEATQYDPIQNEQFLYQQIQVTGNSGKVASATRINMLGNPATYKDSPAGDPNSQDYLHCFVDSYTQLTVGGQNANCGTIGEFNATDTPTTSDNATPNAQTLSGFYCSQLFASNLFDMPKNCQQIVSASINDDFTRYRQYILDVHVMGDYESLTNAT